MQFVELKLKQASAVLGVDPKDLQNLVQMKVLRPPRRKNFYWFDSRLLLEAKLALYLKASLGSSTELLARFTEALSRHLRIAGAAGNRSRPCSQSMLAQRTGTRRNPSSATPTRERTATNCLARRWSRINPAAGSGRNGIAS